MPKIGIEAEAVVFRQDSGAAMIAEINYGKDIGETGVFARIVSRDPTRKHEVLQAFVGKRVRVTIETVEG